jgi:hypothetical protein
MRDAGSLCRSWENIGLSAGNEYLLWTILYPAPQDLGGFIWFLRGGGRTWTGDRCVLVNHKHVKQFLRFLWGSL